MGIHANALPDKDLDSTAKAMITYFAEQGVTLAPLQERLISQALYYGIAKTIYGAPYSAGQLNLF